MEIVNCDLPAFSVIGIEGEAEPGHSPVPALWEEANARFGEVEALALRDENGVPVGVWGAMSDVSRRFLPWEDGFSRGLYLAGVQALDSAQAPEGWTKWTLPAFACLRVKAEGDYAAAFRAGLDGLAQRGLSLAGAVQDCHRPAEGGQLYLFFPFKRLREEA
ncbi:MAG: GyrI-like domain-containing protein [Oscillospiraceae bacterium]|nr:GyrI-like domain-containing protein [Oscillospiraceae bacterium]